MPIGASGQVHAGGGLLFGPLDALFDFAHVVEIVVQSSAVLCPESLFEIRDILA